MEKHSNDSSPESSEFLGAGWFDPIEAAIRNRVRGFIEELVDAELEVALGRSRYRRSMSPEAAGVSAGYRHGRRNRQLLGSFGR
jgi:putative transposase